MKKTKLYQTGASTRLKVEKITSVSRLQVQSFNSFRSIQPVRKRETNQKIVQKSEFQPFWVCYWNISLKHMKNRLIENTHVCFKPLKTPNTDRALDFNASVLYANSKIIKRGKDEVAVFSFFYTHSIRMALCNSNEEYISIQLYRTLLLP